MPLEMIWVMWYVIQQSWWINWMTLYCLFWCFSCSECSGLLTVLLHCSSEMNLKRRSPFSYIPFSFCISTSCHYILVCDWMSWNCGPFHGQWSWGMGGGSQTMEPGFLFFISFLTLLNSRCWGCWEYISMYIVFSLMCLVNKMHMLLQLKLQHADFSFTSAIQPPPQSRIYL